MKSLEISYAYPFCLTMDGPRGKERLAIRSNYPDTTIAEMLFQNLGLMHLVAPYLPEHIVTDFPVDLHFAELIQRMYASEGQSAPHFSLLAFKKEHAISGSASARRVVVAFSSGKDSLWNVWWCSERHGAANVLPVHIAGLNKHNASAERKAAERQHDIFRFPHFEMIDLLNSSRNNGYKVMRSRDMFLVGLCIPFALEFGASQIVIEGFAETTETEPFTGREKNMRTFNHLLCWLGIPVHVSWKNRKELDSVKDLLSHRPEWIAEANSCFARPNYKKRLAESWRRRAPTFPLFEPQCGSCVKCRITNIARILYDRELLASASPQDIRTYIVSTDKWRKENYERLHDMVSGSFEDYLKRAAKKYGVALTSVG